MAKCPSLAFFLRSLPAGSLVGGVSPAAFLAARPAFVAAWPVRVVSLGGASAFAFCAGLSFGVFAVVSPAR